MLSRVAENLYWISRYIERAENVARLLEAAFTLELDAAELSGWVIAEPGPVESVLSILACRDEFIRRYGTDASSRARRSAVLRFLTFDRDQGHAILSMIGRARENARATQEALSGESFSHLNTLFLYLNSRRAQHRFATSPPEFYNRVKRGCLLFGGLIEATMSRTEAYHLLQLGRHLERANQIARILGTYLVGSEGTGDPSLEPVGLSALLHSASAYEAYKRHNRDRIDAEGVLGFLALDPDFPRSIRFCVTRCCDSLRGIGGSEGFAPEAERLLGRLDSALHYADAGEILADGASTFLGDVQRSCNEIGEAIHQAYFFKS